MSLARVSRSVNRTTIDPCQCSETAIPCPSCLLAFEEDHRQGFVNGDVTVGQPGAFPEAFSDDPFPDEPESLPDSYYHYGPVHVEVYPSEGCWIVSYTVGCDPEPEGEWTFNTAREALDFSVSVFGRGGSGSSDDDLLAEETYSDLEYGSEFLDPDETTGLEEAERHAREWIVRGVSGWGGHNANEWED
jgi:hypothetical protein